MEQERIIEIERMLTESRFEFAIKCTHKVMKIRPNDDIAFSPHNIYEGLLMVYFISSGAIEERLKLILCLSKVCKYDLIHYYLLGRDFEQSEYNASAASSDYDAERRCWIKATKFNHLFPEIKSIFNDKLEVFDSDDNPIEEIDRINMAIQSAVKHHMCKPVKINVVRGHMELFLMTVSRLSVQKFQTTFQSNASDVEILHDERKRRSFFSRELYMHVSEFFYTNEKTSLFVFIPTKSPADSSSKRFIATDFCNLMERLSTEEGICTLRNLLDSDKPSEDAGLSIDLDFDLAKDMPMHPLLKDLGIEQLLKPDAINLDSHFVKDDSVHLGNVVHRTHVNVTKKDTVAGSVNVIYTGEKTRICKIKNYKGLHKHPFVWLIYDKQRRNVLFAGAINTF